MKKLLAILLALTVIFSFAACGANNAEEPKDDVTTAAPADETPARRLIINSEPYVITAKDGFNNAGVTMLICDATETYSFTASSGDAIWSIYVLDKEFDDGARYLTQAETPALEGDGVLTIEEGKYIYISCSENGFTADAPSDAALTINYASETNQKIAAPSIDTADCKTFDDVIAKLSGDMAYATVKMDDTDVLLVAPYTFDNDPESEDRYDAAVEAEVFYQNTADSIGYLGKLQSGGSANPLAIADGKVYVGGHHRMAIMGVDTEAGNLTVADEVTEIFDDAGNVTYRRSSIGKEDEILNDGTLFGEFFSAYGEAEVIRFTPAAK